MTYKKNKQTESFQKLPRIYCKNLKKYKILEMLRDMGDKVKHFYVLYYLIEVPAWWATVYSAAKSWTRPNRLWAHTHMPNTMSTPVGSWLVFDGYILLELPLKAKLLSRVRLFVTPWTVAYQVPQSMGFSRQEYWNGLPFPSPGDLPDSGIKPASLALQSDSLPLSHQGSQMPSRYHKHKGKSVQWGF